MKTKNKNKKNPFKIYGMGTNIRKSMGCF